MTMRRSHELPCPKCGHTQRTIVFESINVDINPELKADLFEGKINRFTCQTCGLSALISVPLLYHDMTNQFCVWFVPFEAVRDMSFMDAFNRDGTMRSVHAEVSAEVRREFNIEPSPHLQRPHVVFDMGELARYILFRERLVHMGAPL